MAVIDSKLLITSARHYGARPQLRHGCRENTQAVTIDLLARRGVATAVECHVLT